MPDYDRVYRWAAIGWLGGLVIGLVVVAVIHIVFHLDTDLLGGIAIGAVTSVGGMILLGEEAKRA